MYWVLYRTLQERNEKQFLAFRSQHYNGRIRTYTYKDKFSSVQFSSFTQSCPTLCDPMNHSTPGPPFRHQFPEFTQTHVHRVGDAIQPSHPLSSPSPPALNLSQNQGLFEWVNSSHQVAKVLEFQLQRTVKYCTSIREVKTIELNSTKIGKEQMKPHISEAWLAEF